MPSPGGLQAGEAPPVDKSSSNGTGNGLGRNGNGGSSIDVASIRTNYAGGEEGRGLTEDEAGTDPFRLFEIWLGDAVALGTLKVGLL